MSHHHHCEYNGDMARSTDNHSPKRRRTSPWVDDYAEQQQSPPPPQQPHHAEPRRPPTHADGGASTTFMALHHHLASLSQNGGTNLLPDTWIHRHCHNDHDGPTAAAAAAAGSSCCSTATNSTQQQQQDRARTIHSLTQQLRQVKERMGPATQAVIDRRTGGRSTTASRHNHHTSVFAHARAVCNPMEVLDRQLHLSSSSSSGPKRRRFLNRSALKLANLDAVLGFAMVAPLHTSDPYHRPNNTFVFVDLCGAPGGFSEYILHRATTTTPHSEHRVVVRGYGLSLAGRNEHGMGVPWKLDPVAWGLAPVVNSTNITGMISTHNRGGGGSVAGDITKTTSWQGYGGAITYTQTYGSNGTGDVYQWENVQHLQQLLLRTAPAQPQAQPFPTLPKGQLADLVVADGGMDAQRDCADQEGLAQKLVVCEAAAALACLGPGGTLVLKLFGCQTATMRGLLGELYRAFSGHLQLIKPVTSRPASAERYLVATHFGGLPPDWHGPTWRDRVLLGHASEVPPALARFLDAFDQDMLQLNLQACYAILSYLEIQARQSSDDDDDDMDDDPYIGETFEVPVRRYGRAWRL